MTIPPSIFLPFLCLSTSSLSSKLIPVLGHLTGVTRTGMGRVKGKLAAGMPAARGVAAALGKTWDGGVLAFAAPLGRSARRMRGSGGDPRKDALLLTDPKLSLAGA